MILLFAKPGYRRTSLYTSLKSIPDAHLILADDLNLAIQFVHYRIPDCILVDSTLSPAESEEICKVFKRDSSSPPCFFLAETNINTQNIPCPCVDGVIYKNTSAFDFVEKVKEIIEKDKDLPDKAGSHHLQGD